MAIYRAITNDTLQKIAGGGAIPSIASLDTLGLVKSSEEALRGNVSADGTFGFNGMNVQSFSHPNQVGVYAPDGKYSIDTICEKMPSNSKLLFFSGPQADFQEMPGSNLILNIAKVNDSRCEVRITVGYSTSNSCVANWRSYERLSKFIWTTNNVVYEQTFNTDTSQLTVQLDDPSIKSYTIEIMGYVSTNPAIRINGITGGNYSHTLINGRNSSPSNDDVFNGRLWKSREAANGIYFCGWGGPTNLHCIHLNLSLLDTRVILNGQSTHVINSETVWTSQIDTVGGFTTGVSITAINSITFNCTFMSGTTVRILKK